MDEYPIERSTHAPPDFSQEELDHYLDRMCAFMAEPTRRLSEVLSERERLWSEMVGPTAITYEPPPLAMVENWRNLRHSQERSARALAGVHAAFDEMKLDPPAQQTPFENRLVSVVVLDRLMAAFPPSPTHLFIPFRSALALTGENAAHKAVSAAGDRDRRYLKRVGARARKAARLRMIAAGRA